MNTMRRNLIDTAIFVRASSVRELEPAPISPDWILEGAPEARNKKLGGSEDRTCSKYLWECSEGRFNWHYHTDETVFIVSGEVFVSGDDRSERRLGPGDMAFFPAGSSYVWRVPDRVMKFAVVRNTIPRPLATAVRAWNKIVQMLRGSGGFAASAFVFLSSTATC